MNAEYMTHRSVSRQFAPSAIARSNKHLALVSFSSVACSCSMYFLYAASFLSGVSAASYSKWLTLNWSNPMVWPKVFLYQIGFVRQKAGIVFQCILIDPDEVLVDFEIVFGRILFEFGKRSVHVVETCLQLPLVQAYYSFILGSDVGFDFFRIFRTATERLLQRLRSWLESRKPFIGFRTYFQTSQNSAFEFPVGLPKYEAFSNVVAPSRYSSFANGTYFVQSVWFV